MALYEVPDAGCDYQSDEPPLYIIQVAYPMANFSTSMSALLTILFGNISASGMIRLIDVAFPKKFIAQFQGPKFGVEGLRKVLGVPDRPRRVFSMESAPTLIQVPVVCSSAMAMASFSMFLVWPGTPAPSSTSRSPASCT